MIQKKFDEKWTIKFKTREIKHFTSFVIFKNLFFPFIIFQVLDTTWIYDVVSKTWSEGPKMNTKRNSHACVQDTVTSSIYIAGGYDQWKKLSSTEKWTLEENSWKHSANLPSCVTCNLFDI